MHFQIVCLRWVLALQPEVERAWNFLPNDKKEVLPDCSLIFLLLVFRSNRWGGKQKCSMEEAGTLPFHARSRPGNEQDCSFYETIILVPDISPAPVCWASKPSPGNHQYRRTNVGQGCHSTPHSCLGFPGTTIHSSSPSLILSSSSPPHSWSPPILRGLPPDHLRFLQPSPLVTWVHRVLRMPGKTSTSSRRSSVNSRLSSASRASAKSAKKKQVRYSDYIQGNNLLFYGNENKSLKKRDDLK